MERKWLSMSLAALAVFNIHSVYAFNQPGTATLTLAGAYYHFEHSRELHNKGVPNSSLAYNLDEHWAVEATVGVINTNSKGNSEDDSDENDSGDDNDNAVHGMLYMVDGVYHFSPFGQFEPYVLGGIGVIGLKPNGHDVIQSGNVNAAIGTQLFMGDVVALRGEVRDIYATTGSDRNDFWVNLGLSFQLGGKKTTPPLTTYKQ